MAIHVTGTGAIAVGPTAPNAAVRGIRITVNTGITGTVTTNDGTGVVGIATNPVTGQSYIYNGLLSPVTVTASAAGDFTISILKDHN